MDHCPTAALMGKCPGVSREEIINLKFQEIAASFKVDINAVSNTIEDLRHKLFTSRNCKTITIGDQKVFDLRDISTITGKLVGYSYLFLCTQMVILMDGHVAIMEVFERENSPGKIVLTGHAIESTVETFMKEWAPQHGLVRIYGVPKRGYAGGYHS
ncbi:Hypothetical protein POVR1_LOCUS149 [uncultured virus]|nr:Hypothetical protein POVR1_LOCUS149 [uncultured virus]